MNHDPEEAMYFEADASYEIWSPYDAYEAARILEAMLAANSDEETPPVNKPQ